MGGGGEKGVILPEKGGCSKRVGKSLDRNCGLPNGESEVVRDIVS